MQPLPIFKENKQVVTDTRYLNVLEIMNDYIAVGLAEGFEEGTTKQQIEAWQYLHDTGLAYKLQGWFGRRVQQLIQEGVIYE